MRTKSFTRSVDRIIAALAANQHGVVARWQLLAAGLTGRQIKLRLQSGRLHEIHRGVYLVGHTVAPPLAIEQAALLACGESAVLSHRSAANLWNLLPYPASAPAWVTVPPERSAIRPRIHIRRARLMRRDVQIRHGLRLTKPPRTILDLSHSLSEEELEQVVAEAQYRRLASEAELRAQAEGNEGRRGVAKLRRVLDLPSGPQRTRSTGERAMLRLLRRADIGGFECNARIHGYEVAFLWRDAGVAVELDGWDGHSGRIAFERDRLKRARLGAHGVNVIPVTGRHLRDDPAGAVDRIMRALAVGRAKMKRECVVGGNISPESHTREGGGRLGLGLSRRATRRTTRSSSPRPIGWVPDRGAGRRRSRRRSVADR
jgi:very-short-patch-repair endonuclease